MNPDKIIKIKVEESEAGSRIDKFISLKVQEDNPELSRSRIQSLIKKSQLLLEGSGAVTSLSSKVLFGEEYTLLLTAPIPITLKGENIPLDIIYEDEDLLVINKQSGLVVHPGPGEDSGSLVNALLAYCPDSLSGIGGEVRPGIVHRLDKNTSGLMLVAKHDLAHQHLSRQLEDRKVSRIYTALCYGIIKPLSGTIQTNICRNEQKRHLMRVSEGKGRTAITHYDTQEIILNGIFSLVECKLETGRTHQIRVHLNHQKHSIVGDYDYGNNYDKIKQIPNLEIQEKLHTLRRQFLHAKEITFTHPQTKEQMHFSCDLPPVLKEIANFLRQAKI